MMDLVFRQSSAASGISDTSTLLQSCSSATLIACALCCKNIQNCLIYVFSMDPDTFCKLYSYTFDIKIPNGAVIYKQAFVFAGEEIMGEIILSSDSLNFDGAKSSCEGKGMRLAMPKTRDAFDFLTSLAIKGGVIKGELIIIGVMPNPWRYLDGETDGSNGFVLPKERADWLGLLGETRAYLKFEDNDWRMGDGVDHSVKYFCQRK